MYALCCQVDPNITPDRFWALSMKTGITIELQHDSKKIPFGPILNPPGLIAAIKAKELIDGPAVKAQLQKYESKDESTLSNPSFIKDFNSKMAQLDVNRDTREDVIRIFGEPLYYRGDKGKDNVDGNNLPLNYVMFYPDDFHVGIMENRINFVQIRREGYLFGGKIGVGSSLDDVFKFFGPPDKTVENAGRSMFSEADVLYKDIDGVKGKYVYQSKKYGVVVWIMNDKVFEMTIIGYTPAKSN
jgi:hypothetical protein